MNKFYTLVLFFCSISIFSFSQIPTEGLVGYFPFNGTTFDESGNGNNLLNFGAIDTTDKNDLADNAYYFDNNAIIRAPDSTMFNDLDSAFSISLSYIAYGMKSSWPTLVNKLYAKDNSFTGFYLGIDSSRNILRFRIGSSYVETVSELNKWRHVVMTFGNKAMRLYVNGNLTNKLSIYQANHAPEASFTIGKQSQEHMDQMSWFTGKIDDIRVYNRELSSSEIEILYYDFSTALKKPGKINSINIYPNPSKDHFTFDLGYFTGWDGYTLKITNSLGQIVHKSLINQQYLIVNLPANSAKGIYFASIIGTQSQVIVTQKIILQ